MLLFEYENQICENPLLIRPKSYGQNSGFPGEKFDPKKQYLVPCGKCDDCINKYAKEWGNRITFEMDYFGGPKNCAFITLTYNDDQIPNTGVQKEHIQLYMKRLRERLAPRKIKFYAIGDYGEKLGRPHYHLIIFNVDARDTADNLNRLKRKEEIIPLRNDWFHMHKAWRDQGFTDIQVPRSKAAGRYVGNYVGKIKKSQAAAEAAGLEKPFRTMSMGLGGKFIDQLAVQFAKTPDMQWPVNWLIRKYTDNKGIIRETKIGMGRYLRRRLHEAAGKAELLKKKSAEYIQKIQDRYSHAGINQMELTYFNKLHTKEIKHLLIIKTMKRSFRGAT